MFSVTLTYVTFKDGYLPEEVDSPAALAMVIVTMAVRLAVDCNTKSLQLIFIHEVDGIINIHEVADFINMHKIADFSAVQELN